MNLSLEQMEMLVGAAEYAHELAPAGWDEGWQRLTIMLGKEIVRIEQQIAAARLAGEACG